jgi:hypothetical protein
VPNLVAPIQYINWSPAANGNQYFSPKGSWRCARNRLQGPGINNWDFQLSKEYQDHRIDEARDED